MNNGNEKKGLRLLCLIPIVIGLVLVIFGIVKLVEAGGTSVPGMGEDGWFESTTSKSAAHFAGVGMLMGGLFVGIAGGLFVYFLVRALTSKDLTVTGDEPSAPNALQNLGSTLGGVFSQITGVELSSKKEDVYCEYCGSKLSPEDKKCPNCGAKPTSKKR